MEGSRASKQSSSLLVANSEKVELFFAATKKKEENLLQCNPPLFMVYFQQRKGIWEILQRFNGITLKRGKKCTLSTKQRETLCKKSSVNNFLPEQCVALLF